MEPTALFATIGVHFRRPPRTPWPRDRLSGSHNLTFHGQTAALVVGEAQPSGRVRRAEDPVLFE
jgi:hypothetical protein